VLLSFPEVVSTARRTGRAELDEHAQDVNAAEIDVRLRATDRPKEAFLAELRQRLTTIPGMVTTIGGPIAHRIDHMLSGTRSSIAIKVFGDDLAQLRVSAEAVKAVMVKVPGVVDLSVEQQVDVPQVAIVFDREAIARYQVRSGDLAELVETAYAGTVVTRVLEGQRTYDVVVRYRDDQRADLDAIRDTPIDTPVGVRVPLKVLATIRDDVGPNLIMRENVQRRIVVSANVSGRDLRGVVDDIRRGIERGVTLPTGYYVVYGGQFESEQAASRTIAVLGGAVVVGILVLLLMAFGSLRNALLIMVNLPLALIGGVLAVFLGSGVISIASLVGLRDAVRHRHPQRHHDDQPLRAPAPSRGRERGRGGRARVAGAPVPGADDGAVRRAGAGAAGAGRWRARQRAAGPMGVVILGGLLSSTALNMLVVPALYGWLARRT
jgi:Cu/Ag efflux pump CusA